MPLLGAPSKYGLYVMAVSETELDVSAYRVAEAKNTLPDLIDRMLQGEEVIITRHGKPVAELKPASLRAAPGRGTHEWLRARTRARPGVGLTSVEILDLMYELKED